MNIIQLHNTLPVVFRDSPKIESQIWNQAITFERGQNYLLYATSGTGKSSLCSYIYGYRKDYQGDILFDDFNIKDLGMQEWDDIRSCKLSFLFQELRLFPELTAIENVQLKNNLTHFKTDKQIEELFERLGISEKISIPIAKLSWGQQQRVAIIRALCQPFNFLILDEPISHLDDRNATLIAQLLSEEASLQNAAIIVTSIGKHLPLSYHKEYSL